MKDVNMSTLHRSQVIRLVEAQARIRRPAGEHAAGDLLFVAAGIEHQIEDISEDFAMWRVFYGPPGGAVPA